MPEAVRGDGWVVTRIFANLLFLTAAVLAALWIWGRLSPLDWNLALFSGLALTWLVTHLIVFLKKRKR